MCLINYEDEDDKILDFNLNKKIISKEPKIIDIFNPFYYISGK